MTGGCIVALTREQRALLIAGKVKSVTKLHLDPNDMPAACWSVT